MDVIVAHASTGLNYEEGEMFWSDLIMVLYRIGNGYRFCMMEDGN